MRPTRVGAETRARYGLDPDRPLLALLPGSRKKEVGYLFRADVRGGRAAGRRGLAADRRRWPSRWRPADLARRARRQPVPVPVAHDDTYNVVAAADAAIVASGTATLETALLGCPMVIVYRLAPLTYWIARRLVDVHWIGMPNIILQRAVFPELIQDEVTPAAMADAVRDVHAPPRRGRRRARRAARRASARPGAAARAADLALAWCTECRGMPQRDADGARRDRCAPQRQPCGD